MWARGQTYKDAIVLEELIDRDPLGRIGHLEVRLAREPEEVTAAQAVRFQVFHQELGVPSLAATAQEERDADRYDPICDHLLVIDTSLVGCDRERVVGTYRLLPQERASTSGGFYSEQEFDLKPMLERHGNRRFLEVGRSCVLPAYRSRRTIELLWQGIWAYSRRFDYDVLIGCASFPGVVPSAHAQALSYLTHFHKAQELWSVRAKAHRYSSMDLLPRDAINARIALANMPPLIKGYLRLGAKFGEGCVIDHEFCTTDVLVVLPVESISARYIAYYGENAERFSAVGQARGKGARAP